MKKIQNKQKYIQINNKPISNDHEKAKPKVKNLKYSCSVNGKRKPYFQTSYENMLQND